MKRLLAGFLVALVAACAGPVTTTTQGPSAKPRLVVLFVVDGLPQRQVIDYRDQLAPDGLARFLERGAWFADAHYGHAFTVTAAGHATILTGAYPHRTGIIGNEWRNNQTGEEEYCTGDAEHTYIGHPTKKLDGTSPKKLKVETLGDVLRVLNAQSRVIAISGKDRGAILPAGRQGTAYMYQSTTGQFASTTYYMKEHPKWVADFNAAGPADKYFRTEWKPLLPEVAYAKSLPDNQKWYMKGGALPKRMGEGDKPGAPFYAQLLRSPFADELSLEFARAAIAGEGLGQDDVPDILSISLSGHDYVNHAYSAESRLSHDHLLRLDRMLEAFFRDLDEKVGRDRYIAVLTADHGFMPAPEASTAKGLAAGRFSGAQMVTNINKALEVRFGQGPFVFASARGLVIDRTKIAARGAAYDTVADATRKLLMAQPGIEMAYTRAELESKSRAGEPYFDAMERTWNREVSGDVEYVLKPYWMTSSTTAIATHGSPHPYDTHVPILIYGPAWVKPGRRDARVEVVDIAPTLARILGVAAPAAAEGKALTLD
jgi:predicted AlkP superfamily pyrophosphatase or phosphodiesterase